MRTTILRAGALALVAAPSFAQSVWTQLPVAGPPARHSHGMAHDAARGVTVVYGGLDGVNDPSTNVLGDTWEFDGARWQQKFPAHSPGLRQGVVLVHDAARGVTVLFGGSSQAPNPTYPTDTWTWDGVDWTQVAASSPDGQGRVKAGAAYDPVRERIVLFGGYRGGATFDTTWEWDGSAWSDRTPRSSSPAPRSRVALSYDPRAQRTLLFGGRASNGANLGDTWSWDGSGWAFLDLDASVARSRHGMAYDPARAVTVAYGGQPFSRRTAEWDGASWTAVATDPDPGTSFYHGMVHDPALGGALLFGGTDATSVFDATWLYAPAGGNQPPVAVDDAYSTAADVPLVVAAPGVLANDSDDGGSLVAIEVGGPANGSLALAVDGGFTYTPDPGWSGVDSFQYVASDGELSSGLATVTITVTGADGGELLGNPGFDGGLAGWSIASGNWAHDPAVFHDAPGSARDALTGNGDHRLTQTVGVAAGAHYDASVFVKTQGVTGSGRFARLELVWLNASGGAIQTLVSPDVTGTSDWTLASLADVVAPAGAASARVELRVRASAGATVWFDDASLVEQ